jgi:hypothetical protein
VGERDLISLIATLFSTPLGTIISNIIQLRIPNDSSAQSLPATFLWGSTYRSKFGLTNANHCLIHPSMSLPRSATSRRTGN